MAPTDNAPSIERLASVTHGSGQRVFVGVHGWHGSQHTFDPLVEHLPTHSRFVSLDLPGYGQSAAPPTWTLEAIAAQIVATVDEEVGHRPVSMVGSCSGGVIGLFVAPLLGSRLDRFVFVEPFAFVPDYLRLFVRRPFGPFFYHCAFGNPIGRWITNRALSSKRRQETDLMESFAQGDLEAPLRYLQLFDRVPAADYFGGLPGQKQLIWAEHTFEAIRTSADIWQRVWPACHARRIDGAGHLLLAEAAGELAECIFG